MFGYRLENYRVPTGFCYSFVASRVPNWLRVSYQVLIRVLLIFQTFPLLKPKWNWQRWPKQEKSQIWKKPRCCPDECVSSQGPSVQGHRSHDIFWKTRNILIIKNVCLCVCPVPISPKPLDRICMSFIHSLRMISGQQKFSISRKKIPISRKKIPISRIFSDFFFRSLS